MDLGRRMWVRWVGIGVLAIAGGPRAMTQTPSIAQDSLPTFQQLFDRHNAAVGGRRAMAGYTSIHIIATGKSTRNGFYGVTYQWNMDAYWMRPNRFVIKHVRTNNQSWRTGFDGRSAWTTTQYNPAGEWLTGSPGEGAVKAQADFLFPLLDRGQFQLVDSVHRATLQDQSVYQVRVVRHDASIDTLYFDATTGYKVGETVRALFWNEEKVVGTKDMLRLASWRHYLIRYSDYQLYGKIRLPRVTQERIDPLHFETTTIDRVEFNRVEGEVFQVPYGLDTPSRR